MRKLLFKIAGKITMPMCIITICMSVFNNYLYLIPYIFVIRIILLLGAIVMVIGGLARPTYKKSTYNHQGKNFKERFYLNSYDIIENIFIWYYFLYMILRLEKISLIFMYIMILLFGIYYGHRIANIADIYYKNKYKKD
jgi:hypothetical protein